MHTQAFASVRYKGVVPGWGGGGGGREAVSATPPPHDLACNLLSLVSWEAHCNVRIYPYLIWQLWHTFELAGEKNNLAPEANALVLSQCTGNCVFIQPPCTKEIFIFNACGFTFFIAFLLCPSLFYPVLKQIERYESIGFPAHFRHLFIQF